VEEDEVRWREIGGERSVVHGAAVCDSWIGARRRFGCPKLN